MRYQGKRAVVTGAASGIGRATALLVASEGARVPLLRHRRGRRRRDPPCDREGGRRGHGQRL